MSNVDIISSYNPDHHTAECKAALAEKREKNRGTGNSIIYGCSCKSLPPKAIELESVLNELEKISVPNNSLFWDGFALGVTSAARQIRKLLLKE